MIEPSSTSILTTLGYQVLSQELGVYVLCSMDTSSARFVALMLADEIPTTEVLPIQLFIESVPSDVSSLDIVAVWQMLNARRFEETGLVPVHVDLGPLTSSDIAVNHLERPEGGLRSVLLLSTGDVVCLN